jgi:lambda family phage tail tape measure protein
MNLLGESGALVVKTTEEQAIQADAYEKNVKRLQLSKDALYKTISMSLLPTVNAFVESMIDVNNETDGARKAVKGLAEDGSLKEWSIVSGYAVAGLADTFSALGKAALTAGMTISTPISAMFKLISGDAEASANKIASFKTRMDELWGGKSFTTRFGEKLDNQTALSSTNKPTITGGNTGSVANSSGDNFLQSLESRIKKGEQGEYAMLRLQAAEKGVLLSAEPLIEKIKAIDEARTAKSYEDTLARQNSDVEFQIGLIGKTASEVEILNIAHKNTLELSKQISDAEKTKGALSTETITRMTEATETATRKQIQLIESRQNYERNWESGASRAMQNYADNATNYGKTAETAFTNGFRNMEDAIVQFATTGKLNFNSFANSVVADIMRIYARMVITGLVGKIAGAFAGNVSGTGYTSESPSGAGTYNYAGSQMTIGTVNALGNAFTGGKVTAFANGGIVGGPTLFPMANGAGLMGEAGPEAVMPLARDSSGRLGVRSGGGGSVVQVNVVNQATADGYQATATQSTDDNGKDIITVIVEKVKGAMNQDVRNNGPFAQLLSNKYGLRGTM